MNKELKERVQWIDNIKALGMFIVYYGHFVHHIAESGSSIAYNQAKFLYSFTMPLFFIISGFFFRPTSNFHPKFKKLFIRRIVPVFSFGVLLIPLWIIYYRFSLGTFNLKVLLLQAVSYCKGSPELNIVTWFLVCLFTAEIIAMLLSKLLVTKKQALFIGVIALFSGLFICEHLTGIIKYTGIAKNTWYIHESIVAVGLYLIGTSIFQVINDLAKNKRWLIFSAIPILLIILLFTYNLNQPYENFSVVMGYSKHGSMMLFVLSAISGSLLFICLGIVLPINKIFSFVGRNTLLLLGLNGIFHYFINGMILNQYFPTDNWFQITLYSFVVSIISIAVCYPIIKFINKYLPQLFGEPFKAGPLIPNLEEIRYRSAILNKIETVLTALKIPITRA